MDGAFLEVYNKTMYITCVSSEVASRSLDSITLLPPNRDHMKDSDKQDHVRTWEFWCDNTVHTARYEISVIAFCVNMQKY